MSEIRDRVIEIIAKELTIDAARISDDMSLVDDLGADSVDRLELLLQFETLVGFPIPSEDEESLATVGAVVAYVEKVMPDVNAPGPR